MRETTAARGLDKRQGASKKTGSTTLKVPESSLTSVLIEPVVA